MKIRASRIGLCLTGAIALALLANGAHLAAEATESNEVRLMRFPDISGDRIAFAYADKLWVAKDDGGEAQPIDVPGERINNLRFSPDGRMIAFSATADGNSDIYIVPADGSAPAKRLTHHPAVDRVADWRPDGKAVLFTSTMSSPRAVYNRLHTISVDGGLPEVLPLPYGETATYSADGTSLLFTYLQDFQEEAWKRYYGGRAPDIFRFDFATGAATRLTSHPTSDSTPMVVNGHTYYLTERDAAGRSNIWKLGENGAEDTAITAYTTTDIRRPATDSRRIIFEVGGRLAILDPASCKADQIIVRIDRANIAPTTREVKFGERIDNASLTSGGVIVEARGDIVSYRTRGKTARNLTANPAAAERFPRANARGDIAYVSDAGGEYALYVRPADGGAARKLADFGPGLRYNPFWSPDGSKIAIWDYEQVLWLVDVASGTKTRLDQGKWGYHYEMLDATVGWSPDSRWLAWSRGLDNRNNAVFVRDTQSGEQHQLTSGAFNDFAPVFDISGNYLLMLSHRRFNPTYGDSAFDNTWTYTDGTVVSALALRNDVAVPGAQGPRQPAKQQQIAIDATDAERRLVVLPAKRGQLSGLRTVEGGYVVMRPGAGDDAPTRLERYDLAGDTPRLLQSEKQLALADTQDNRILTRADEQLFLVDAAKGKPAKVELDRLAETINIATEAQQMFNDSWRYARDFYYDPGLHSADWNAVRRTYEPLVPYVTNDEDLNVIVREMVGELNGGHVYASSTRRRLAVDATNVGLLGIDFARDDTGYRIAKIYRSGAREFEVRSPLDNAALDVREGDHILSVNGKALTDSSDPWEAFADLADKDVTLTLSRYGTTPRTISVKTLDSERKLRELAWVEENRRKVDAASGGRIGYIYVPNTTTEGLNELMIGYRSQFNKDGLLIDARFNTGGALGDRMVELLNRPPLVYFRARNSNDYPLPELAHRGPKAFLTNSWSYSGGDGFPLLFKQAKVGPVIGTRTWGGLIGPGLFLPLVNGGFISSPPQRVYGTDGEWSEGNEGVMPDIEVQNDPRLLVQGTDQQLEAGVANLMERIRDLKPVSIPTFPDQNDWNPANRKGQ